ncbi:MAG TPA: methyl-accepting chemotaxis protein [Marinobacter sp.]|nr:methyl-accepting chemotaxis protein [Marinobacter sp.]
MALSWKHKFYLLIAATFLGLAVVLIASLSGLNNVSKAYEARGEARSYEVAALTLLSDWLMAERLSDDLTPDTVEIYQSRLQSLAEQASTLAESAKNLNDTNVEASAATIAETAREYIELRTQWLGQTQVLGFTGSDGLKAELNRYMSENLRQMGISLFDQDVNTLASAYRNYLDTADPAYADTVEETLDRMIGVVDAMEWRENVIGESIIGFRARFEEARGLVEQLAGLERRLGEQESQVRRLITTQNESLRNGLILATSERAESSKETSLGLILIVSIAVLLVLVITLIAASRTLVRRLGEVVRLLSQAASGDLSQRLKPGRNPNDEFNQLGNAANQMFSDMSAVLKQVVEGNQAVAELQSELDTLIHKLGDNGERVEEETEQTATAVQEIAHTAVDIAQYTQSVNESAQSANAAAQAGTRVITRSADSMTALAGRIQQTHDQIGQLGKVGEKVNSIVGVINGLAEQTNLLALNAAIEAARAGEAGRGFSVVADEVRSLAEKTVSATNGIADIVKSLNNETNAITRLMEEGLASASDGKESANEAALSIDQISQAIDKLATDMNQVVGSIEGISTTTEEIAQKVEQIHGHTRETADIRQQLTRHVSRLSSQTQALTESTRRFQL